MKKSFQDVRTTRVRKACCGIFEKHLKVPFAYAADCTQREATTTCNLIGSKFKFMDSVRNHIGIQGHMENGQVQEMIFQ